MRLTRKQLKKIIMEQVSQNQLAKLENLLRSENEADIKQGLFIVQTLLDDGGVDDYPKIESMFYEVATEKDDIIQRKRKIRSKHENNRIKITKRIMQLNDAILNHKHSHSHPEVIKLRKEFTFLLDKKSDISFYIELADNELEKLVKNYRMFEEFPINMGDSSIGTISIQDPMMESNKYRNIVPSRENIG